MKMHYCPVCNLNHVGSACEGSSSPTPVYREGVSFIAEVPEGANMIAFNDRIILCAPGMKPCFVTPTGLVPLPDADGTSLG